MSANEGPELTDPSPLQPGINGAGCITDWEHTFDVVSDLVAVIDTQFHIVRINKALASKLGVRPDDVVGASCYSLVHGTAAPPSGCPCSKMMRDGKEYSAEIQEKRLGGSFEVTVSPRRDADGTIIGCVHVARDVSERKHCEETIRREKEYLQQIIQSLTHPFYVIDVKDYRILLSNAAAGNVDSGNMTCYALTHKRDDPCTGGGHPCPLAIIRETKKPVTVEHVHYDKNGNTKLFEVHGYPLLDRDGNVNQVIEYCIDITDRRRAEEELLSAHRKLEQRASELDAVNRELEAYSRAVSHDLKAPLRRIQGFSHALMEDCRDQLDATGRYFLDRVNAASQRATQLIEAMLNMARLTRSSLSEQEVNLSSLAQICAHELQRRDPGRQVEFVITEKAIVHGDMDTLDVVMQNLLENAWKFTGKHPRATIEFGVSDMKGEKVYFVRDDGAGLNMQFADRLFKPFRRLHTEAEFPGLGMGLSIVYGIIARHNGKLWVESQVEKGATFYFTLG